VEVPALRLPIPAHQVTARLEDDGFVLWESLAINMYLAEPYAGAPLWPAGAKDHALVYQ